jgi:hypothetical protein
MPRIGQMIAAQTIGQELPEGKMGIYEFGRQLIETLDLDPIYVLLYNSEMRDDGKEVGKWLLAYWCFYHCGTASWITDQKDYWKAFMQAASSKEWPRSSERRHFRGIQAVKATQALIDMKKTPQQIVSDIGNHYEGRITFSIAFERAKRLRGFGDWIGFKVTDMLERLDLAPITFQPSDIFSIFDSPRKGAEAMAIYHGPSTGEVCQWAHDELVSYLADLKAPPSFDRPINIQEAETILCKFKSHLSGHYEVGKDIKEVHHGLKTFKYPTPTVNELLVAGKKGGLWS